MPSFTTLQQSDYGRRGVLDTAHGDIQTPALFPVLNLIGGTTPESGGIWRYTVHHLVESESLQAGLFQAMSFLDYGVTPTTLATWREKTLREHYRESKEEPAFPKPLFVDSGGFKLMNSTTFGQPPEAGGKENEWGIYTNPESILDLQLDYGADIIATLDYPIPPNLNEAEATDRMERSIDSAVECLELLQDRGMTDEVSVYVAIHGHTYEDINWYVGQFLERAKAYEDAFEGFAIGSLVPLSNKVDVLVDIVQGAKDAIPEAKQEDIALHVFGISGRLCPLLALLGVDSFDSANYLRAARNKRLIHPETWKRVSIEDIDWGEWPCQCAACSSINFEDMKYALLDSDITYQRIEGEDGDRFKSEFYAEIAHHNFELYGQQMDAVRTAIEQDRLLEHVVDFARGKDIVEKGLKRMQLHNPQLREQLESDGHNALVAGPETDTFQSQLSAFFDSVDDISRKKRTISLEHGPSDFDVLQTDHQPPDKPVLLILPCSQEKPYSASRTQQAVLRRLTAYEDRFYKLTMSGLYGPVPVEYEEIDPVMEYEYVLTTEDTEQVDLVANRLYRYLDRYGDGFDHILAYTTSKAYRTAIETAFARYGRGDIYPSDPRALQLTEHFRNENIDELLDQIDGLTRC